MKLRYPDEKLKNALRLMPLFLLVLATPLGAKILYDYFQGPQDNVLVPVFIVLFAFYFGFRAYHAVRVAFVFGDEEGAQG